LASSSYIFEPKRKFVSEEGGIVGTGRKTLQDILRFLTESLHGLDENTSPRLSHETKS